MDPTSARAQMVTEHLIARGIKDARVLAAMAQVPREAFVPLQYRDQAYEDTPLPIGEGQTISQPYIVALMTEALQLKGNEQVLEVGAGSGYQTAILARLARQVWSIEKFASLATQAHAALAGLAIDNVVIRVGDGSTGWAEHAPYAAIIVAAAAPSVPEPLQTQLEPGGRLILPVGSRTDQDLECWQRRGEAWHIERLSAVRFVPLRGQWGWNEEDE